MLTFPTREERMWVIEWCLKRDFACYRNWFDFGFASTLTHKYKRLHASNMHMHTYIYEYISLYMCIYHYLSNCLSWLLYTINSFKHILIYTMKRLLADQVGNYYFTIILTIIYGWKSVCLILYSIKKNY